jgi:hypothetical protein
MIAHSTALESITMEVADLGGPRPSIVGAIRYTRRFPISKTQILEKYEYIAFKYQS